MFLEEAENGDFSSLKSIFADASDPNFLLSCCDNAGNNAFLCACIYGNLDCAIWLVDVGSNKLSVNKAGQNAFQLAFKNKHSEVCRWLASIGLDTDNKKVNSGTDRYCITLISNNEIQLSPLRTGEPEHFYTFAGDQANIARPDVTVHTPAPCPQSPEEKREKVVEIPSIPTPAENRDIDPHVDSSSTVADSVQHADPGATRSLEAMLCEMNGKIDQQTIKIDNLVSIVLKQSDIMASMQKELDQLRF